MDRTNARYLEKLPEVVDLVTIDASFISLKLILPAVAGWLQGQIVALIKPQFEAGPDQVGHGGVVRDPAIHQAVLQELIGWSASRELGLRNLIRSPITGPAGNVEFLAHWAPRSAMRVDVASLIEACVRPQGGGTGA
jgi:23S rRNA (cytidine1920-2'-O)/16S rRNA (cytidine1409-2'-O)-methyltransferase